MKYKLGILILVIINFGINCYGKDEVTYTAIVIQRYGDGPGSSFYYSPRFRWPGVILNPSFILSADIFDGKEHYNKELMEVHFMYHGKPNFRLGELNGTKDGFFSDYKTYDITNCFVFDSLLLIKLGEDIHYYSPTYSIRLPDVEETKAWKNLLKIPNNTPFTTSYWTRLKTTTVYYHKNVTIERKCPQKMCLHENGLIPGCFTMEKSSNFSLLQAGSELLYEDTLVGIRRFTQEVRPFQKFPEDYFINIAAYTNKILYFMKYPLRCEGKIDPYDEL